MPKHSFQFSFGPWNIHGGADPFGPPVRDEITFARKLGLYRKLGFTGIQLHDDDAVPRVMEMTSTVVRKKARQLAKVLKGEGLAPEFVAPRLWEDSRTVDGGFTSNSASERRYALERSLRSVEIAQELGCSLIVLWLAREGSYIREAKNPVEAMRRLRGAINALLAVDRKIRIAIEPKPNEPMDLAYLPTVGHAMALGATCADPSRIGIVVESAHAILAGLDPSDEMAFAIEQKKLWTVHLNDQNGLKFDQDKPFGSVDLRRAFNQVRILVRNGYGRHGEMVGLDVKAVRTQRSPAVDHLRNSRETFLRLLEKVETLDLRREEQFIAQRDYEGLDAYVLSHLMGRR